MKIDGFVVVKKSGEIDPPYLLFPAEKVALAELNTLGRVKHEYEVRQATLTIGDARKS